MKGTYRVLGSRGIRYTVTLVPQYSCECPDWSEHGNHCKHFMAVVLYTLATSRATEQEAESLLRALAHRSRVLPELHS